MFPKSIFYLLFFVIMDLILKSIRDKKKIQEEKTKETTKSLKEKKPPRGPEKTPKRQKPQMIRSEKFLEMQPLEEPLFDTTDALYSGIQDEIGVEKKSKKSGKTLELQKEEFLKGIIYSEILSKPKSLRK